MITVGAIKKAMLDVLNGEQLEKDIRHMRKRWRFIEAWKVKRDLELLTEVERKVGIENVSIWLLMDMIRSRYTWQTIIVQGIFDGAKGEKDDSRRMDPAGAEQQGNKTEGHGEATAHVNGSTEQD